MLLYKKAFEDNEKMLQIENKVYSINAEISHLYLNNRSGLTNKDLKLFESLMRDLLEIHNNHQSYNIQFFTYDLIAFYYLNIRKYDKVIQVAEEGKKYFSSKSFADMRGVITNNLNIINAYIYKNELDKALAILHETLQFLTIGTRMWVRLKSFEFIIYTLQNKHDDLYRVYTETEPRVRLDIDKEEWLIRSAYIHFLIRMGKITVPEKTDNKQSSFVLSKFLNSVTFYSKDKSGLNISIIIIQILFYFLDKKWDKVLDKIDGLKQYSFRYLTKDESMRSNCFIKMLIAAEKAHFSRQLTITYTKSLYEKMTKSPYVLSENSAFVEIVPYETLWEITLELLSQNTRGFRA
jgi:hypothetical protein